MEAGVPASSARMTAALDAAMLVEEGTARFGRGDLEGAVASWRAAVAIDPRLAEAWFDLANAEDALGDPRTAIESYRRALEIRPDLPEAWNNLGNACVHLGSFDAAIHHYRDNVVVVATPDV